MLSHEKMVLVLVLILESIKIPVDGLESLQCGLYPEICIVAVFCVKPLQWLLDSKCFIDFFLLVNPPEVHLLHLHVAVYMFFHRLYAMYPNNFLMYLRNLHNEPSKRSLFQDMIKVR